MNNDVIFPNQSEPMFSWSLACGTILPWMAWNGTTVKYCPLLAKWLLIGRRHSIIISISGDNRKLYRLLAASAVVETANSAALSYYAGASEPAEKWGGIVRRAKGRGGEVKERAMSPPLFGGSLRLWQNLLFRQQHWRLRGDTTFCCPLIC